MLYIYTSNLAEYKEPNRFWCALGLGWRSKNLGRAGHPEHFKTLPSTPIELLGQRYPGILSPPTDQAVPIAADHSEGGVTWSDGDGLSLYSYLGMGQN